jgi:hypothetical protein
MDSLWVNQPVVGVCSRRKVSLPWCEGSMTNLKADTPSLKLRRSPFGSVGKPRRISASEGSSVEVPEGKATAPRVDYLSKIMGLTAKIFLVLFLRLDFFQEFSEIRDDAELASAVRLFAARARFHESVAAMKAGDVVVVLQRTDSDLSANVCVFARLIGLEESDQSARVFWDGREVSPKLFWRFFSPKCFCKKSVVVNGAFLQGYCALCLCKLQECWKLPC